MYNKQKLQNFIDTTRSVFVVFRLCPTLRTTRNQAVARIADRTAKNCRGHVT